MSSPGGGADRFQRRLLFVDDEEHILMGLKRLLRSKRKEWKMVFALGGPEALDHLQQTPFDVVVTDMRMPGMDGADVLTEVKRLRPECVRIVLSGHCELSSSWRVLTVSHQFLAKPCKADELIGVIERACAVQELLTSERLKRAVGGLDKLPSAPRSYTELNRLLGEPDVGLPVVARVVKTDPALAAKTLQIVNSAYFGLRRRVTNVSDAVNYLGVEALRHLALACGAAEALNVPAAMADHVQDHALRVVEAAMILSDEKAVRDPLITAALLHDLGELLTLQRVPPLPGQRDEDREAREREALGASHSEIGAYLLGIWGIPYDVVDAIAQHHQQPSDAGEPGLRELLFIAGTLADEREGLGPDRLDSVAEKCGWTERVAEWRTLLAAPERRAG